jgi:hypothetical protein
MDGYTLHASNVLKLSFISSVPDNPIPRAISRQFFYFWYLTKSTWNFSEMPCNSLHKDPQNEPKLVCEIFLVKKLSTKTKELSIITLFDSTGETPLVEVL